MKTFLTKVTLLTIVIAVLGALIFGFLVPEKYSAIFPLVLLFFYLFTIFTHYLQIRQAGDKFSKFARVNMIVSLARLLVYSAVIIVYLVMVKSNVATFIILVCVLYILYTFLETKELTRIMKNSVNSGLNKEK